MAATKKYAGLPDLDDAGTELYQTPGLTDDASTIQASTVRTESPTPSEDANENFDRSRVDRDEARRRFEPAVVGAKDVNFSYAVGGSQRSYTSRHRRRRRARRSNPVEEFGDVSDEDDTETEETLSQKLARLKREAEEVKMEIERQEKEDGEFQDSFEHQQGGIENEDNDTEFTRDMNDLNLMLDGLKASTRPRQGTVEEELKRQLNEEKLVRKQPIQLEDQAITDGTSSSAISAVTAFSDRLSAIELALGLSNLSPSSNPTAILPLLEALNRQVNLLNSTISPKTTPTPTSQSVVNSLTPQMPHLDILQSRLHTLHQSATSLLNARKSAQTALSELETVRLRGIRNSDGAARFQTLANRRNNRPLAPNANNIKDADNSDSENAKSRTQGGGGTVARRAKPADEARERVEIADEILTPLFLEDQAEKIKALYMVLPTIQDLQPLLPVVLERLRSLSVVHAGAASVRNDMDDLERRLKDWEGELEKWKVAVEGIESGIGNAKGVMKENVEVVGGLVRALEERVERLERNDRRQE